MFLDVMVGGPPPNSLSCFRCGALGGQCICYRHLLRGTCGVRLWITFGRIRGGREQLNNNFMLKYNCGTCYPEKVSVQQLLAKKYT